MKNKIYLLGIIILLIYGSGCSITPLYEEAIHENSLDTNETNILYVEIDGDDANDGSKTSPLKTINEAISRMHYAGTINIGPGTFNEKINIDISGKEGQPIVIRGSVDETGIKTIIESDDSSQDALIQISHQSHIALESLILQNNTSGDTPMGILVEGGGSDYRFENIVVTQIIGEENAHGIVFYGTDAEKPLEKITINKCQIYDCQLGFSEALVLNGNVSDFVISNNIIFNNDNIGIDCIGFENTASKNDQARNGIITQNQVYNISSLSNPAYGGEGAAGGIYIDGGKDIIISYNKVIGCDIGIEVASEHFGKVTDGVEVVSNLVADSKLYGIAVGGASTDNGFAKNNYFANNVILNNAVDIAFQQSDNNIFTQNQFYTSGQFVEGDIGTNQMIDSVFLSSQALTLTYDEWYQKLINPEQ